MKFFKKMINEFFVHILYNFIYLFSLNIYIIIIFFNFDI